MDVHFVFQIFLDLTRRLHGKLPSVRGDVTKGGGKQWERRGSEQAPTPAKFNIAPEKYQLEDYFPGWEGNFSGANC